MVDELLGIFAHTEEVSLLLCGLYRTAAVGALSIHHLGRGPEGLAGRTVKALIMALIDIALFVELLKNLLHLLFMVLVSGADEFIIGCVHQIPDIFDLSRHVVHKLLGRHAGVLGL